MESRSPLAAGIKAREIRLATNRVEILFSHEKSANGDLLVALESLRGWLVGDVSKTGWAGRLPDQQRQAIVSALAGLYKTAALELVCQQIQSALSPPLTAYEIGQRGIIVYPNATICHLKRGEQGHTERSQGSLTYSHSERSEESSASSHSGHSEESSASSHSERSEESPQIAIIYDLIENTSIVPHVTPSGAPPNLPVLDRRELMFSELQIAWDQWVRWWEAYQTRPDQPLPALVPFPVLPKN